MKRRSGVCTLSCKTRASVFRRSSKRYCSRRFANSTPPRSRQYGGTGLGLAICARLANLMGGRIWVESEGDRGSIFHVTLLVATAEDRTSLAQASQTDPDGDAMPLRILLAEDNLVNQKVILYMLQRLGHQIEVAANGREAVHAAEAESYDVILMDMNMPQMDGLEATRLIRRRLDHGAQPFIIALTASALQESQEECLAAGMDDFVAKPVRPEQLAAALQRAQQDRKAPA